MSKLLKHFKAMQSMCAAYLEPIPYEERTGAVYEEEAGKRHGFINDMIYMLDGPEQREAEAEAQSMADQGYPTEGAYLAVCRALHWRTAELRYAGIEPLDLSKVERLKHYPPDGYKFPTIDPTKRLVQALSSGKVRRSLRKALARGYAGRRHLDDDTPAPEGIYYACRLYDDENLGAYAGVASPDHSIICEVTPGSVVGGNQEACMAVAEKLAAAMNRVST